MESAVRELASAMVLGALLESVRARFGSYELLAHWKQGEFHHDVVLRLPSGEVLVVATNCNGGVKEVVAFPSLPARGSLWHSRCPQVPDFVADEPLPPILARATTEHWFDPCALLAADARSELLPEARERQQGGGWQLRACPPK